MYHKSKTINIISVYKNYNTAKPYIYDHKVRCFKRKEVTFYITKHHILRHKSTCFVHNKGDVSQHKEYNTLNINMFYQMLLF